MKIECNPMHTAPKDGSEILLVFGLADEVLGKQYGQVRAAHWSEYDWSIPYWKKNPPIGWMPIHPSKVQQERDLLRAALEQLVGASTVEDLETISGAMKMLPSDNDTAAGIAAIEALLATHPERA